MGRKLKTYYSNNPNEHINLLGKKGLKIFPKHVGGGFWQITLANTDDITGANGKTFGKRYVEKEIVEVWYKALEYYYNQYKD